MGVCGPYLTLMTPDAPQRRHNLREVCNALRWIVLERLVLAGEGTATTLANELSFSRQAVVKHLAHLDRVRLVQARRRGRDVRYRVEP